MTQVPEYAPHSDVERLFRAHAGFVASFLARLGVPPADVDDAVQEVFTVAYRKGGFSPGPATARTWLGAIAVRIASSHRRTLRRRRELLEATADVAPSPTEQHGGPGQVDAPAHASLERREALARVQRALDQLELGHRAVFVLFELEGEDCGAIAEALDLPVGTVYSRLHTARKRFLRAHAALLSAEGGALAPSSPTVSTPGDRP